MSREVLTFGVADGPVVELSTFSGDIGVDVGVGDLIQVDLDTGPRGYDVEHTGSRVSIAPKPGSFRRLGAGDVNLTLPSGTDLIIRTTSGDVRTGRVDAGTGLGVVEIATASGDVRLKRVEGDVRIKTASGDVRLDEVAGNVHLATASGHLRAVGIGADLEATTASGSAHVDLVNGDVGFKSASGDLVVTRMEGKSVRAKTLSGDVRVGIPPRREIQLDLDSIAGELRHDLTSSGLEPVQRLRIDVTTVSGDTYLVDG